jgi:hypothetical protein
MHYPPTADPAKIAEMNAKLKTRDLAVSAHGVQDFSADHEANRRFFQFAKAAGIRNISANPSADSFDSLDKLVEEFDIRIAIHNHGPGARYDKAEQAYLAVQKHDKRIGYCADLGHYIRSGEDPVQVIKMLGDRLYGSTSRTLPKRKRMPKELSSARDSSTLKGSLKRCARLSSQPMALSPRVRRERKRSNQRHRSLFGNCLARCSEERGAQLSGVKLYFLRHATAVMTPRATKCVN